MQKKIIIIVAVAIVAVASIAIGHTDNPLKTLSDKQLFAAIDSCLTHDLPQSAEPYFKEAKHRARINNDARTMLNLIDKELSLNANRIETTVNMLAAIDKEIAAAQTPLTEMLMLRKAIVAEYQYKDFAKNIFAQRDTLRQIDAYSMVDSAEVIVPMSLYDYLMLANSELYGFNAHNNVNTDWRDNGSATSKILYELLCIQPYGVNDEIVQIINRIYALAFSPETEALAHFVKGEYYFNVSQENERNPQLSDAYADSATVHLQKAAKILCGKALQRINNKLSTIDAKSIDVGMGKTNIPNSNIPIRLTTKNLQNVDVDIYCVNNGDVNDFNPKKEKPVANYHFSIPKARGRIGNQSTYTELRELPLGHYELVARHDTLLAHFDFQVTDISTMQINTDSESQIVLRSATNGEPLPQATIDTKKVDNYGMLSIDKKWKKRKVCNGKDQIEISASGNGRDRFRDRTDSRIAIVTDRSIYRPGQTVELKAWIYKANYEKKWADTEAQKLEVVLHSHNGTKIADTTIVTNDFGTASGKLRIPSDVDLGYASIEIKAKKNASVSGYCSINIEEYKRSGNRIEFDPIKVAIAPGDSVKVSGYALSADNKPIIDARIEIEDVAYDTICTIRTDADGRFSYTLATDSTDRDETYSIFAKMTDLSGETTETETNVNVNEYGSSLQLNVPNECENTDSISLTLESDNFNGQPFRNKVTYTIYKMRPSRGYKPYVALNSDTIIGSTTYTYERFPIYTIADTVLRRTIEINGDTIIKISAKDMATGVYRIMAEATSYTGKRLMKEKNFSLRAHDGKCELNRDIYLGATDQRFTPGKDYHFYVGTNLPKAKMLVLVEYAGKIIDRRYLALSGEIKQLAVAIPAGGLNYENLHIMASITKDNETFDRSLSVIKTEEKNDLDIQFATWRNHNVPGATQTATFTIGSKNGTNEAEVLASMYDTRLDRIRDNKWRTYFYRNSLNSYSYCNFLKPQIGEITWDKNAQKQRIYINLHNYIYDDIGILTELNLSQYNPMYRKNVYNHVRIKGGNFRSTNAIAEEEADLADMSSDELNEVAVVGYGAQKKSLLTASVVMDSEMEAAPELPPIPRMSDVLGIVEDEDAAVKTPQLRTDFRETVFFYPHLRTDSLGNTSFSFTLPDNITTYRFRAIAHDKQMNSGFVEQTLTVSKPLTVKAWLPRVVTEGDTIIISMTATCDSSCNNVIASFDVNGNVQRKTSTTAGKQHQFNFNIVVPDGADSLRIALSATNGQFTDGERHSLPVLSRYKEITESQPFMLQTEGKYTLANPFSNNGKELVSSFSYTCNTWTEVLRALPHLHNCTYPSSDTYLGQIESSAIAMMLMQRTDVQEWVAKLKSGADTLLLKHEMEKNSPWVRFNDLQHRHDNDVLQMLSGNTSQRTYNMALRNLQKMQLTDGSFPWFKGMDGSEYITRHILSTLGMLVRYGMVSSADVSEMCAKGQAYIENQIAQDVAQWERDKVKNPQISDIMLHRLYTLTCLKGINTANVTMQKVLSTIPVASKLNSSTQKLTAAIILNRIGRTKEAQRMLQSVCENLVRPDDYSAHISLNSHAWYNNTTLVHSMLILAMNELTPNNADQPRVINWLLREKRTTHWNDTQATSRAVLALLTQKTDNRHTDIIAYNNENMQVSGPISIAPSPHQVTITHTSPLASWGSWQRTALLPTDQMQANNNADISITRTIEGGTKVGDKVTITLTVTTAEDMDYVRISDYRPSAFEPLDQTSGYHGWWWLPRHSNESATPHYFSPRDASVDFFIERLPRGKHTFSYQCYVTNAGEMAAGYAEAVSMYTEGMEAHTEGERVDLK